MCGVCAGRRGKVGLGDVIFADRLWTYDTGATVVELDEHGKDVECLAAEPLVYNLSAAWKHRAESFRPDGIELWVSRRPRAYDHQADWLLARLAAGDDPRVHPKQRAYCADFDNVVRALRRRGWLTSSGLALTAKGSAHIHDKLLLHPGGLPDPEGFAIHVGAIATGTTVVRDQRIFEKLSGRMRNVLGLEMEAASIGAVAHLHNVEYAIVVKGVMDYADAEKCDNFKSFAARASAECLVSFLRANLGGGAPRADLRSEAMCPQQVSRIDEALCRQLRIVIAAEGLGVLVVPSARADSVASAVALIAPGVAKYCHVVRPPTLVSSVRRPAIVVVAREDCSVQDGGGWYNDLAEAADYVLRAP
jgi:nucleoside phosphorylase